MTTNKICVLSGGGRKKCREKTTYKSTPEQRKEYNKQSYLRRKEKLQKELEEKQKNENI